MAKKKRGFAFDVVNFLVALAVLMILAALFVPLFVPPSKGAKPAGAVPPAASAPFSH